MREFFRSALLAFLACFSCWGSAQARDVTLVYVSASDCPWCRSWESAFDSKPERSRRALLALPELQGVGFRQISTPAFRQTGRPELWPEDLRWVVERTNVSAGTPRFVLIVDGVIVRNSHSFAFRDDLKRIKRGEPVAPLKPVSPEASDQFNEARALLDTKPPKDIARGIELMKSAAELGSPWAQGRLAWYYRDGVFGLPKDPKQSFRWATEATANGNASAYHTLGRLYRDGLGVERSAVMAVTLFQQCADSNGSHWCALDLARMHRDGAGISKDRDQAVTWYERAIASGNEGAKAELAAYRTQSATPLHVSWLVGKWTGEIGGEFEDKRNGRGRTLLVHNIASTGVVEGGWSVSRDPTVGSAEITLIAQTVRVVTSADSVVELTSLGRDQLQGTFRLKSGRSFPINLRRVP